MLSIIRRMRTREPTCLSIGLGAFLAINISYTAIVSRNFTSDGIYAIRYFPSGDMLPIDTIWIIYIYQYVVTWANSCLLCIGCSLIYADNTQNVCIGILQSKDENAYDSRPSNLQ